MTKTDPTHTVDSEGLQLDVVDFFSGCGGTSAGLREAGLRIVAGIDVDPQAAATFQHNFPEAHFVCRDIRQIFTSELEAFIPKERTRALLFAACAPCQPFSKQNRERHDNDDRETLLDEFHRFVVRFRPEYLFIENVPGIQKVNAQSGPLGRFLALLGSLDYYVTSKVVDFLEYGIPQTRQRFVLIASLIGPIAFPSPTNGPQVSGKPYSTVWEWIHDLPPINQGEEHLSVANHRAAMLSPRNLERIKATPEGGDRRHWPQHLLTDSHRNHDGHTDVYGRLHRDKPACTMTTRCVSLSNGRFGHPTQDRALSIREAACLQTFPRDFTFCGTLNNMAMQIGNAVPVQLAKRFGETMRDHSRTAVLMMT